MNRLKQLRTARGLSLKEVANEVGIAESQLSFYENGKRKPRDEKIWLELARFYKVSVGYLLGNTNLQVPQVTEGTKELWKQLESRTLDKDDISKDEFNYITSLSALESSFESSLEILHSIAINEESSTLYTNSLRNYAHSFKSILQLHGPETANELSNSVDTLCNIISLQMDNIILKEDNKKGSEEIFKDYLEGKRKISESLDKLFLKDFEFFKERDMHNLPPSHINKLKEGNDQ
ncbi:helix-turn-helix domain-containing protein [Enterococcus malodoratus]|uniref:helix-turn-helix domain-containing protein n=1 Tax=Enterococcus malodoratus TaxID=71451 RepID=UPI0022E74D52|nr:helix-turn-helix transcriptional regulator [Enterococcus malodoratus]